MNSAARTLVLMLLAAGAVLAEGRLFHRRSVDSPEGQQQLQLLIQATKRMQQSNPNEALVWSTWSNWHRTSCLHSKSATDYRFLLWHRAYLLQFEKSVRALGPEYADFAVPYTKFFGTSQCTGVPAALSSSAPCTPAQLCLKRDPVKNCISVPPPTLATFRAFAPGMESSHNQVHAGIGNGFKKKDKAADDPLFWIFHAEVDLYFDRWLRANPSEVKTLRCDSFVADTFLEFPDPGGPRVKPGGYQKLLSHADELNYVYDDDAEFRPPAPVCGGGPAPQMLSAAPAKRAPVLTLTGITWGPWSNGRYMEVWVESPDGRWKAGGLYLHNLDLNAGRKSRRFPSLSFALPPDARGDLRVKLRPQGSRGSARFEKFEIQ